MPEGPKRAPGRYDVPVFGQELFLFFLDRRTDLCRTGHLLELETSQPGVRRTNKSNVIFDLVGGQARHVIEAGECGDAAEHRVGLWRSIGFLELSSRSHLRPTVTRQLVGKPQARVRSLHGDLSVVAVGGGRRRKAEKHEGTHCGRLQEEKWKTGSSQEQERGK
jgi:hypothetical protein